MYQHLILTYSGYTYGKRISFHKCCKSMEEIKSFMDVFESLKREFETINFGFHHLQTSSKTWKSVVEYDRFFSDVEFIKSLEEFKRLILLDTTIDPLDIAKLILYKCKYTQLEVQKLIYFFWRRYQEMYGEDAWEAEFVAWPYGPVIKEVYEHLKKYKKSKIKLSDKDESCLQIYSRIIKIPKYEKIFKALDETIKQYGNCSAFQLVDKSHIKGGPWDLVYKDGKGRGRVIPKELIKANIEKGLLIKS